MDAFLGKQFSDPMGTSLGYLVMQATRRRFVIATYMQSTRRNHGTRYPKR